MDDKKRPNQGADSEHLPRVDVYLGGVALHSRRWQFRSGCVGFVCTNPGLHVNVQMHGESEHRNCRHGPVEQLCPGNTLTSTAAGHLTADMAKALGECHRDYMGGIGGMQRLPAEHARLGPKVCCMGAYTCWSDARNAGIHGSCGWNSPQASDRKTRTSAAPAWRGLLEPSTACIEVIYLTCFLKPPSVAISPWISVSLWSLL